MPAHTCLPVDLLMPSSDRALLLATSHTATVVTFTARRGSLSGTTMFSFADQRADHRHLVDDPHPSSENLRSPQFQWTRSSRSADNTRYPHVILRAGTSAAHGGGVQSAHVSVTPGPITSAPREDVWPGAERVHQGGGVCSVLCAGSGGAGRHSTRTRSSTVSASTRSHVTSSASIRTARP